MCSIIGFLNYNDAVKKTLEVINKLNYRGNDAFGLFDGNNIFIEKEILKLENSKYEKNSKIAIGHNLLSLVNYMPQPIKFKNDIFVSNCEIYNYKQLNDKYNLNCINDSDLLFKLIEKKGVDNIVETLEEIDGVYAFSYYDKKKNEIILVRDLLGVKPIFYSYSNSKYFAFASEKKVLFNLENVKELNPKTILKYNIDDKTLITIKREFYKLDDELKEKYDLLKKNTKKLLFDAIKKRVPNKKHKIGILFSGGIDSTFIAYVLKQLGVEFTCYTAKLEGGNIEEASDLIYAKEIAKKYGFKLKIASINTNELKPVINDVINIIEDRDHIKVAVALPFYLSCKIAKDDNIKVMFSGLGSEEIFAGYLRHRKSDNPNQECVDGLSILHIRDLYRDDTITMSQNMELRLPFLDRNLIEYSLNIPEKYKLNLSENRSKIILRDIAFDIGLDKKYSERAKKAAQYGSKFDKGLHRLAKNKGVQKQEYLNEF